MISLNLCTECSKLHITYGDQQSPEIGRAGSNLIVQCHNGIDHKNDIMIVARAFFEDPPVQHDIAPPRSAVYLLELEMCVLFEQFPPFPE